MPRIVDHDQRRAELVQHVWALIREEGLGRVTVRALAERSGWSSGAVRHYLPDHVSILSFAAQALDTEVERHLRSLRLDGLPLENFARFLEALLPLDEQSRAWTEVWLAFAVAAVRGEDYADAHGVLYQNLHGAILDIVRDFADKGWWLSDTPAALARTLHAYVDGLTLHVLLRQVTPEGAREGLRRQLLQCLQPPEVQEGAPIP